MRVGSRNERCQREAFRGIITRPACDGHHAKTVRRRASLHLRDALVVVHLVDQAVGALDEILHALLTARIACQSSADAMVWARLLSIAMGRQRPWFDSLRGIWAPFAASTCRPPTCTNPCSFARGTCRYSARGRARPQETCRHARSRWCPCSRGRRGTRPHSRTHR